MNCNKKTMLRVGVGLAVVFSLAYFLLPDMRTWVVASAPLLVALICPLAMLFMMKSMGSCEKKRNDGEEKVSTLAPIPKIER